MNIIYMGTPEFAVPALNRLCETTGVTVSAVFTQPDRARGRGRKVTASPVHQAADSLHIPVYQPEKLRSPENAEIIRNLHPDLIVVAAYGQILPEEILEIPRYGCVNLHASLLPKYRGASPVEASILAGDKETGVTLMYMAKGLDTGDMIASVRTEILPEDTCGSLTERLSCLGAELLIRELPALEKGTSGRTKQKDGESSYAGKISKETGYLDFRRDAAYLDRLVRAMRPDPGATAFLKGKRIRIFREKPLSEEDTVKLNPAAEPGMVAAVTRKYFVIRCGKGALQILSLQPEGKKIMEAAAFLNGNALQPGDRFTNADHQE